MEIEEIQAKVKYPHQVMWYLGLLAAVVQLKCDVTPLMRAGACGSMWTLEGAKLT